MSLPLLDLKYRTCLKHSYGEFYCFVLSPPIVRIGVFGVENSTQKAQQK